MYQLAVWFVLSVPFIGLVLISLFADEYFWLTSGHSAIAPLGYYSIFLLGATAAVFQFKKVRVKIVDRLPQRFRAEYPLLIVLFIILVFILVGYGGLYVLLGSMSKEDVRLSGFLHAVLTKYMAPSIFAYLSALRRVMYLSRGRWWLALLMTFVVGLSTGGKASALIVILPGLMIMFADKLTLVRVFMIGVVTFGSLMVTAWLFDSFLEGDIVMIAGYLLHRIFALTAEAPFHVAVAYSENQVIIDYPLTLLEVLGKSLLSNLDSSIEIHKYIFSYAITAWLYPEHTEAIASGTWNITPNVFVEALIVGGAYLLPILGWAVVYTAYALWSQIVQLINSGKYAGAAITSVYAVMVYLSWTNSAGIMQLIHPLAIGSLTLSWLCLRTLSRNLSCYR